MNDPIAIWNGEIVEGHGRFEACKKIGFEKVPVIRLDGLTDQQRREYMLVHNKTTMNSDFDIDMLNMELNGLDDFEADFYDFDISFNDPQDEIVEDEAPEPKEEPIAKHGDVYALGKHRLMCGDSTVQSDVEKLMSGQKADLLLTDPPYNVDYEGANGKKILNDKMDDKKFRTFLRDAFTTASTAMKPGAVFYIWHADSEGYNFRGACSDAGLKVRQCLIWEKNTFVLGRQDYQWKHEPCLYGWKDGASHLWASDRRQATILKFDKPLKSKEHPTMKPVELFDYQIKNNTKGGDIVLDIFGGSGTTIIACEQNGRHGYSMELDPRYVDVIIRRWESFTGKKSELISEGN